MNVLLGPVLCPKFEARIMPSDCEERRDMKSGEENLLEHCLFLQRRLTVSQHTRQPHTLILPEFAFP